MKILLLSALTLAAAVFTATPVKAQPIAQTIQVNKDNRTIAITATDKVIVMADTATVHIGFVAYGPRLVQIFRELLAGKSSSSCAAPSPPIFRSSSRPSSSWRSTSKPLRR